MRCAIPLVLVSCVCCLSAAAAEPAGDTLGILVAMHHSGKIERYDAATGRWLGTFIYGAGNPSGLAWGPDGNLYVSSGAVGGPGKVTRYHGRTGAFLGHLVAYPPGHAGYLARGNGLAFHGGELFVSSCDDGKIKRYDAGTGAWLGDLATVKPVSITQIRFHQDVLHAADYQACAIRRFRLDGTAEPDLTSLPGFAAWGLAFDQTGTLYWSGSAGTIQRFDGQSNTVFAGADRSLKIPIWLELGPDGRLYSSSVGVNAVDAWGLAGDQAGKRLLRIQGPEVQGPVGLAFTRHPLPPRHLLTLEVKGRTTSPETPDATPLPAVRLEALSDQPTVTALGWDTEGGDRARHNLLRAPVELLVQVGDGWRRAAEFACRGESADSRLTYRIALAPDAELLWEWHLDQTPLVLRWSVTGPATGRPRALRVVFPFDPRLAATTVIAAEVTRDGVLQLPAIVSAPDLGQMLMTCPESTAARARLEGDRAEQWVSLTVDWAGPELTGASLRFSPVVLPTPRGLSAPERWPLARRGWFNFLQINAQARGNGVWANNVISNPVSNTVYWLGDCALLIPELAPGVPLAPVLRRTLEFWMYDAIEASGQIHYTEGGTGGVMTDANPAVLIGAWCYVEASGDRAWLARQIERLEFIAAFTERLDGDADGLIESPQSGNRGTHAFGDTAWDTYSSGHKNAYVNALAYRAYRCLADLEKQLGRDEKQAHYTARADAIKAVYAKTFYNPDTGWLGWWRSQDGFLHDIYSDVPTDLAILFGLVDRQAGERMMAAYWQALEKTGFSRFDLGVPLNLRPVHRDDQYGTMGGSKEDGSETFGKFLNGGCCVSNTYFTLAANYVLGHTDRADRLLDAMLKRQHEGVFPNGGGFQNGVVNRMPEGAEFFEWNGATTGYEGHLVYSWAFLQTLFLREPQFRARLFRPLGLSSD